MNPATDNLPLPPGRSWRNIRQEVSAPAMSRQGRRRQLLGWLKGGALAVLAGGTVWGAYAVARTWTTDRAVVENAVHSEPVHEVVVLTDGVLTRDWVTAKLALPKKASLMALDLPGLRDRLLASGQVRVAVLTRNFPDTLVVTLQERTPVARVRAADGLGATKQLLVAKDGVVYDGLNYAGTMLAGLPWLDGIRLVKTGKDFAPIAGMADVAALLSTAQLQAPHLYREWLIVSLARLAERDEIVVKAQDLPEIVFSRKRDYYKQIAQLDTVIDATHRLESGPALLSVNLALDGQVPVRLDGTPDELAAAPAPLFPLQSKQRKANRDF